MSNGIETVSDMYDALLEQSPQDNLDSATRGDVFVVGGTNEKPYLKQLVPRDEVHKIGHFDWDINQGSVSNVHIIE